MTFDRPPLERYVRTSLVVSAFTMEPAVEHREGDDFREVVEKLRAIAYGAAMGMERAPVIDTMIAACTIGQIIEIAWPDRAYFVEVWQEGHSGFAQVFQPFGVPRNQEAR